MRTVGQFRAMNPEDRAVEKVHLQSAELDLSNALASVNKARAELDARLEAGYAELAKMNRQAHELETQVHDVRQDLAGLLKADEQIATEEKAAHAVGEGVTAGTTVQ